MYKSGAWFSKLLSLCPRQVNVAESLPWFPCLQLDTLWHPGLRPSKSAPSHRVLRNLAPAPLLRDLKPEIADWQLTDFFGNLSTCKADIFQHPLKKKEDSNGGFLICMARPTGRPWQPHLSDRASLVAQWWRICLQCMRPWFDPWVGKIPWRREWRPTSVFLPGESHGQRSLVGCSPRVTKSQKRLSDFHFHFS